MSLCKTLMIPALAASALAQTPQNPLDGLTSDEYWVVYDVLQAAVHLPEKTHFSSVLLHEPLKDQVLVWTPGKPFSREADVTLVHEGHSYHDHFFSYRLDLDVDGPNNTLMVDRLAPKPSLRPANDLWLCEWRPGRLAFKPASKAVACASPYQTRDSTRLGRTLFLVCLQREIDQKFMLFVPQGGYNA